jgi:hypothetical protein
MMKIEDYTVAHGPPHVVTVVAMPAFAKMLSASFALGDIKVSALVQDEAPLVEEFFIVYASSSKIPHRKVHFDHLLQFLGTCVDGTVRFHVFYIPELLASTFLRMEGGDGD